ncbi:MAG: protein phosphatase 2C domain-containing protein [Candidatus Obscuribacterales bacterium]|nr:protein phosphatase 2C domain-containing protein [Candidatus Obscuribacterales bacterium]
MTKLAWSVAAVTDRGLHRSENQDNFYISPDMRVFVVADGMGGLKGGARASKLAVDAVEAQWKENPPDFSDREAVQQWLVDAVASANQSVFTAASQDESVQNMGTTIVAGVQTEANTLQIAHVGDSRAYLIRDGKTIVLTQDHSVVMEMVLKGQLTPDQFKNSPFRHYLTRCVGHSGKVEIDRTPVELNPDDLIILSTDGLSAVLDEEQIFEEMRGSNTPKEICDALLKSTLDGGAPDNVTILAVKYSAHKEKEEPVEKPRKKKEKEKSGDRTG